MLFIVFRVSITWYTWTSAGGGARVGRRPHPPGKSPPPKLFCNIGSLFATFLNMGAFLLRFSHYGEPFHHVGPFCYFLLHGGGLFWACPPPPPTTEISWGVHAGILVFDYRLWILSNINDTFIILNVIGI